MTTNHTHQPAETLAERLAAAAGVGALAAGAALDAAEGDEFLRRLLTDQMASAHLLTMHMAARADAAVAAAAVAEPARLPLLDQAAARYAGAAARLSGRYRQGLLALSRLAAGAPQEPKVAIIVCGEAPPLSPAERARRVNRARYFHGLNRKNAPAAGANDNKRPSRPSLGAAASAALAPAEVAAAELLFQAGAAGLLADPSSAVTLLAHQLAASHRMTLLLTQRTEALVAAADDPTQRPQALRLAHGAARLMGQYRQGLLALERLRGEPASPGGPGETIMVWTNEPSDLEQEEERREDIAHGLDPVTGLPQNPPAAVLKNRGRLNNGNPGGDFLAAPRCGACTRHRTACRQPAMANGRCRFHGGKSTGPRTAAGLARSRAARYRHGLRSAEVIALGSAAAATHRRLGALLRALRPAGHGVDRSKSTATVLPFKKIHHEATKDTKTRPLSLHALRGFVVR